MIRTLLTGKSGLRGLTLIELAIVLGVIGLISGAIWAAASSVRSREPIHDSVQLVSEIASNVRGVYTGFPTASAPSLQEQIDQGLFPISVVNEAKDDTVNAWNGTIHLKFPSNPLNGFSIEFTLPSDMPEVDRREACLGMITRLPGTATINPATNAAWSTSETLPSGGVPRRDSAQGFGPSLVFVNTGGWKNVTGQSADTLFGSSGSNDCTGFAYYYRL